MWLLVSRSALAFGIPALSGLIQIEQPGPVAPDAQPVFTLRVPDAPTVFWTECVVEGTDEKLTTVSAELAAGEVMQVALPASPPVSTAECILVANFANGLSERRGATISWSWVEPIDNQ